VDAPPRQERAGMRQDVGDGSVGVVSPASTLSCALQVGLCRPGGLRIEFRGWRKSDVVATRGLDLVDAFDAVDALDAAYAGEDGFELAAVGDFEAGVDAGVLAIGAAFEHADVGAGAADHRSNFG
jgi:hypothetical protein